MNRIVWTIISGAYRDRKGGGRVSQMWRNAKVDEGKERRCVGKTINEVTE